MKNIAIFPGTFDPITHGHVDLINRATRLFDKIVIAVSSSTGKSPLFPLPERLAMIEKIFSDHPRIEVISFSNLLVDVMQEKNIAVVIRGIRTSLDTEFEFQLSDMNAKMKPDIDTVFLKADQRFASISSTIVREIVRMTTEGSLGDLSLFVPQVVIDTLSNFSKK